MSFRTLGTVPLLLIAACATATAGDRAIDYLSLYYAVEGRNRAVVQALLERGAPVNLPAPDLAGPLFYQAVNFDSPLQAPARNGELEIVRLILEHHPWIDHRCCDSPPALGLAADAGHTEIVALLLDAGADSSIVSYYAPDLQGTPLDAARRHAHAAVVEVLKNRKPR